MGFLFHSLPPYRHQPDTLVTVGFLYNSAIGISKYLLIEIVEKKISIYNIISMIFIIQYLSKESDILFCSITHANIG